VADKIDPSARAHARLSASKTKLWMNCAGAPRMAEHYCPKGTRSSKYAELGTAAHSLVEECVGNGLWDSSSYMGYWICHDGTIERAKRDPKAFQVDRDMVDSVNVMLNTVWTERDRLGPASQIIIEEKFDLSWVRPNMFGNNDVAVSLFLDHLTVIDYKHGAGVPVDVYGKDPVTGLITGNTQLMYYALGALAVEEFTHETVDLVVVQPRCPHSDGPVRRYSASVTEARTFVSSLEVAADRVAEADASFKPDSTKWQKKFLRPGSHCRDGFCPVVGHCPARHKAQQTQAADDFGVVDEDGNDVI
jgi:hypothetical protein